VLCEKNLLAIIVQNWEHWRKFAGVLRDLHHVYAMPEQCNVAKGTQFSMGTWVRVKYFSHCLNQLNGYSPVKTGESIFGRAIERLKWSRLALFVWFLCASGWNVCM
jgi:hypothetical protein